jgi:uncharacterized membrane protein
MLTNGFVLAIAIIAGMLLALAYAGVAVVRGYGGAPPPKPQPRVELAIPLLALAGLGVAGYLAYVEATHAPVVCGPIGDCNSVQNSPYSRLFDVPVTTLGGAGYLGVLAAWIWGRVRGMWLSEQAPLVLFCLTLFGTLLSLYLTYLEPFVIRAVCIWCLASAVIMSLLLLLSLGPMLRSVAAAGTDRDAD